MGERVLNVGLTGQDDMQGTALAALQVRQQAQLLQDIESQMLCLVNQEQRRASLGALAEQIIGDGQPQCLFAASLVGQPQLIGESLQQGDVVGQVAVGQERAAAFVAGSLKQAVAQQCLAHARLTRQQEHAFLVGD